MNNNCGGTMELALFPEAFGGSIPTSPLQFNIIEIPKGVAATMYEKFHYLSGKDFLNSYSFGAQYDGDIWAVISYGIPNAKNIKGLYSKEDQSGVMEITRLVCHPNCPKNTPSRIIRIGTALLRQRYPLKLLISYADTAQNHEGGIYKASGFKCHGLTAQKTDFRHPDGMVRKMKGVKYSELEGQWIPRSRKYLFSKGFK